VSGCCESTDWCADVGGLRAVEGSVVGEGRAGCTSVEDIGARWILFAMSSGIFVHTLATEVYAR